MIAAQMRLAAAPMPWPETNATLLVDTHVHLDDASFAADCFAVYQRAQVAGVKWQIIPAVDVASWARIKALTQKYTNLYAAYGLHPLYLQQHNLADLEQLQYWLANNNAVAVGECGLDYYLPDLAKNTQITYFTAQLAIASQADLPLIIHARRAVDDVIKYIRRFSPLRGVVHSFVGSEQQANQLIKLGFYLGFGGPVTYLRAQRLRHLVQILPLERILLETDAPDQPLSTRRGQRNEPAYLSEILTQIAQLRQQSATEIAAITTQNAINLFNLDVSKL
jgi:TatD DNase family protein